MRFFSWLKLQSSVQSQIKGRLHFENGHVEEEGDESIFWLEMIPDVGIMKRSRIASLLDEADQIVSIVVSSIKTAKRNRTKSAIV